MVFGVYIEAFEHARGNFINFLFYAHSLNDLRY